MPDCWTALQFDNAVMMWGRYIENALNERNEDGSAKHRLRDLLDLPFTDAEKKEQTRMALQMFKRLAGDPRSGVEWVH